jgi:carbonic anhydrase
VTRNVGNVVPPYGQMNGGVSTAIEYAVLALGVQHIIVCGHSDCGAMRAVLNPDSLEKMPTVKAWLRHAEVARRTLGDQLGHDARVGTGNEHRPWALSRGKFFEELFLLGEDVVMEMQKAVNDML